ncbi:hypothetical protein GCM10020331_029110 [Ectobacillus funiculus]
MDRIEDAPLTTLGPVLEKHEMFPDSVNVEFVEIVNEKEMNFSRMGARLWYNASVWNRSMCCGSCGCVKR